MTQRDDYVNDLLSLHVRYNQGSQRCEPDISGYGDCSGVICWATRKVGINLGCTGSFALAQLGHHFNTGISIEQARNTKGAWVFQGINQGQGGVPGRDPGHIGTSLGNGQTFEARGHIAGVGVFDFNSIRWVWACQPPYMTGFDQAPGAITGQVSKGVTNFSIDYVGMASNGKGGYWIGRHNGQIYSYGALYHGGVNLIPPAKQAVGIEATPDGGGYWLIASDGGVFAFGNAIFHGSMGGKPLNRPIVGMAATASGKGYWLVASDGGIFSFGDATFHGSMGGKPLNKPIVAIERSATGNGYWMVASDGGIFSFGDAQFYGSMGGHPLNKPIVGMTRSLAGKGYRMVASDGGIFSFGDAPFYGSMSGVKLAAPITGMATSRTGKGYWIVASDGGIFSFGDAHFIGNPIGL